MTDDLTVLDPRFPIALDEMTPIFWKTLPCPACNPAMYHSEVRRAYWGNFTEQERFVRPMRELTAPTAPVAAIEAPRPEHYAALTPANLARDDEITATVTTILALPDDEAPDDVP